MTKWLYKGEGNNHIVVTDVSSNHAYRLLKRARRANKKLKVDHAEVRERIESILAFCRHVMLPRIGSDFLHCGELVDLPEGLADLVNSDMENLRPEFRRVKQVDVDCPFGLKMADVCFVRQNAVTTATNREAGQPTTYALEIKLKWGFMPTTNHVSQERNVKHRVCRYCMHQHLKVDGGMWKKQSDYCPIDIFSGIPSRMKQSLRALFNNPQNNLRLFKDGGVVWDNKMQDNADRDTDYLSLFLDLDSTATHGSDRNHNPSSSAFETFLDLMVCCLLYTPPDVYQQNSQDTTFPVQTCRGNTLHSGNSDPNHNDVHVGLPVGCVLHNILSIQRMDDLDIEGLFPLYDRIQNHLLDHAEDSEKFRLCGPYTSDWCTTTTTTASDTFEDNSLLYAALKVRQYLVSRSAKDCSVIIATQPATTTTTTTIKSNIDEDQRTSDSNSTPNQTCTTKDLPKTITDKDGRKHNFSVAVIDLDPKSADKIPFYMQEDKDVVEFYLQSEKNQSKESVKKDGINAHTD